MDVVYLVRSGERNEQLRYSLRSLANLPHHTVWIAGHRPAWVAGVRHIEVAQDRGKWANQAANIRAACQHPDVSDTFAMFNDDFYVIEPVDRVPTLHGGPLSAIASAHVRNGEYARRVAATADLLDDDALTYDQIHVPMVFDKAGLLPVLDEIGDGLLFRTVYGNRTKVGGVEHPNVKIKMGDAPDPPPPFWSTSSKAFRQAPIGRRLREMFDTPCRYER